MSLATRVLIVIRDQGDRIAQVQRQLIEKLVHFPEMKLAGVVTTEDVNSDDDFDLVIALGGDGTIVRTCRQMGRHQRPIVGVNLGRLGFLADLTAQELLDRVPSIARREYKVVPHLMYHCQLYLASGAQESYLGLNEVAILSAGAMQLLQIDLSIDDELVSTFVGDGLLVSTPVGSTAHSLAAGGPILKQDLQAFVITPICPHTLTNRPLVDGADCVYRMQATNAQPGVTLAIDGQIKRPLSPDDVIEVRKADVAFQIARLPSHSFYSSLHRKLGWAGHPNYGAQ